MRHIIFILILSSILVPLAAAEHGLSKSELSQPIHDAISQASVHCLDAVAWLRAEVR